MVGYGDHSYFCKYLRNLPGRRRANSAGSTAGRFADRRETMEKFLDKLRSNSLLIKILSVMLLSVVCVATLTLSISIRASEDVYVDTFTQSNSQIIGQIRETWAGLTTKFQRS